MGERVRVRRNLISFPLPLIKCSRRLSRRRLVFALFLPWREVLQSYHSINIVGGKMVLCLPERNPWQTPAAVDFVGDP
jgi:hypothetical protein